MAVEVANIQEKVEVSAATFGALEAAVAAGLAYEGVDGARVEVSVALVDDERIRELNRRYRAVDSATDVLSFPMDREESEPGGPAILGDVVISMETVSRESGERTGEVGLAMRLVVHGLLHLLGYDHESPEDARDMERREEEILRRVDGGDTGERPT